MREINCLLLAAGIGSRLRPLTDHLPKCLMPIDGKPLLEIWLDTLESVNIKNVLINLHYMQGRVLDFLDRPKYKNKIDTVFEKELLGTAGTIRRNYNYFKGKTTLLIHADNLCICDFQNFINYHFNSRPSGTLITMMTFQTQSPKTCGIVELDSIGVVQKFHEKVENPPGNLANAAIYLMAPEVLEWIVDQNSVCDFSTEVLPNYLGKIATWKNNNIMRDIGNIKSLRLAQNDFKNVYKVELDEWELNFKKNSIHKLISNDK